MEWEQQLEEKLSKNVSDFLLNKLSEIDCTEIMINRSDKFMDLIDGLNVKIRCEIAEFVKLRAASIVDEEAENIKAKAKSWLKEV